MVDGTDCHSLGRQQNRDNSMLGQLFVADMVSSDGQESRDERRLLSLRGLAP